MNIRQILLLPVALIVVTFAACSQQQQPARDPRLPDPADSAAAVRTMMSGMSGMMNVQSYHAVAELELGKQRGRIEGDFGPIRMDFLVNRLDGVKMRHRVIQGTAWRSADSGRSWQRDTINEGVSASMLVLGPVNPKVRLEKEGRPSVVGFDTIAGTEATHVRIAAMSPIDIWIGPEKAGGPTVIRRIRSAFSVNDVSGYSTVTYSAFNAPLSIVPPEEE